MNATELNRVIRALELRGLLIDGYKQVFGGKSFDEVLDEVNGETAARVAQLTREREG